MSTNTKVIKRYFRSLFDLKGSQEDETITDKEVREGVIFKGVSDDFLWENIEEYLIEGTAVGISLINMGFLALVIAILLPA